MIENLTDAEFRHLYVSDQIRELLAMQIRLTREQRGWTQAELGERAGMAQVRVSLLEDPDNAGMTLRTLKRLAKAFDVALVVRFAPFSELVEWTTELSFDDLAPESFTKDAGLHREGRRLRSSTPTTGEHFGPEAESSGRIDAAAGDSLYSLPYPRRGGEFDAAA